MRKFIWATISAIALSAALSGCSTVPGSSYSEDKGYRLKPVDDNGKDLPTKWSLSGSGIGVYTARKTLCAENPNATILITEVDFKTKQEKPVKPYKCGTGFNLF